MRRLLTTAALSAGLVALASLAPATAEASPAGLAISRSKQLIGTGWGLTAVGAGASIAGSILAQENINPGPQISSIGIGFGGIGVPVIAGTGRLGRVALTRLGESTLREPAPMRNAGWALYAIGLAVQVGGIAAHVLIEDGPDQLDSGVNASPIPLIFTGVGVGLNIASAAVFTADTNQLIARLEPYVPEPVERSDDDEDGEETEVEGDPDDNGEERDGTEQPQPLPEIRSSRFVTVAPSLHPRFLGLTLMGRF